MTERLPLPGAPGPVRRGASLRPRAAVAALAAALLLALAACGRKGDLEPAPDPSVAAATSAGESVGPVVRRSKRVLITPPKQPFILDPLL